MPTDEPTLQDLIRRRQQTTFIGRDDQLAQYRDNLRLVATDERRKFIFDIHGNAGVGKTYLTRQLSRIIREDGALTAYIDESTDDIPTALTAIAEQLASQDARLNEFEKRYKAYLQRRQELEADPQAPADLAAFLTKTAVRVGLQAARGAPIAGSILAPIDDAAVAEQIDRARAYVVAKLKSHADVRLILYPGEELTPIFVRNLDRAVNKRAIALFIDTYEQTGLVLDSWLRDLYAGKYGDLPATLVTTVSGRHALDANLWADYLSVIADLPLEPFSETEARQLLTSKSVTNERTVNVILTLTGRLPLLVAMLAEGHPEDPDDVGDPTGDAVERFLKWEDNPARRNVAIAAALPRALNQDILAVLSGSQDSSGLFGWLRSLPFVVQRGDHWSYHPVVRAAMIRLQRLQSPHDWRVHHIALADAHAQWAVAASGNVERGWADSDWIDHTREQTYHQLCADPIAKLPVALASAVKAAEYSSARARQWAELIRDAGRDTERSQLQDWGQRLLNGIRGEELGSYLTHLISDGRLDAKSLNIAYEERGESFRLVGNYEAALADFTHALELDPVDVWAIRQRGATLEAMHDYQRAVADYTLAIELQPDDIGCLIQRGFSYQMMGCHNQAKSDLTRAIKLDPGSAWAVATRGMSFYEVGLYTEAAADLSRAIELDPSNAWIRTYRGLTYQGLGIFDKALADFTRAIDLDSSAAFTLGCRAELYRTVNRHEEAVADYTRALQLDSDAGWLHGGRGATLLDMRQYDEAVGDFTRAIELDLGHAWAFARRGEAYRLGGNYEEAVADLTRAIEIDPAYVWAIGSRGQAYVAMKDYDEALADFTRAVELDPDRAWLKGGRGLTLCLLERHGEAISELTRAIELDPEYAGAVSSRGETFHRMGLYDEAITDLTRAVELDPGDAGALANRGEVYHELGRYDEALADLTRAIELDSRDADALAKRGEVLREIGRYDEAVADLTHAVELGHDDSRVEEMLSELMQHE